MIFERYVTSHQKQFTTWRAADKTCQLKEELARCMMIVPVCSNNVSSSCLASSVLSSKEMELERPISGVSQDSLHACSKLWDATLLID